MTARTLTRRRLLRSAFWSAVVGGGLGTLLCAGRYAWAPRIPAEGRVLVPAGRVPVPGAPPLFVRQARFFLVHLRRGEGAPPTSLPGPILGRVTPGAQAAPADGVLALSARCPLRGCTVFWRDDPGSEFLGLRGFFRCPCCGSVFTRAGIPLFGPAPLPLATLALRPARDGTLLVDTRTVLRGGPDNAQRIAPCGRVC